jgi:hypothetical protein
MERTLALRTAGIAAALSLALGAASCEPAHVCQGHGGVSNATASSPFARCKDGTIQNYHNP